MSKPIDFRLYTPFPECFIQKSQFKNQYLVLFAFYQSTKPGEDHEKEKTSSLNSIKSSTKDKVKCSNVFVDLNFRTQKFNHSVQSSLTYPDTSVPRSD